MINQIDNFSIEPIPAQSGEIKFFLEMQHFQHSCSVNFPQKKAAPFGAALILLG